MHQSIICKSYSFLSKAIIGLFLLVACSNSLQAQSKEHSYQDSLAHKQKDVVDVLHEVAKIHIRADSSSIKGNGPFYSVLPAVGYALQSGLTGAIVLNASFFTDSSKDKFSNIQLNGNYSQYQQYWFHFNTSVFFDKLKLHLVGDNRYYNFPTNTYGLGTSSSLSDALAIDYSYLRIYEIIFRELSPNIFAGLGYNLDYHWNINVVSNTGKALLDFEKYEKSSHSTS